MNRIFLSLLIVAILTSCYNQRPELNIKTYKEAELKSFDKDPLWDNTGRGLHASFGSTDIRYNKHMVPMETVVKDMTFTAWRGETVSAQAVLWSVTDIKQVECVWQPFISNNDTIATSRIKTRFVRYVLADEYRQGCESRAKEEATAHLVADVLDELQCMDIDAMTVRPVWITIDVPESAKPGVYKTSLKIYSRKNSPQELRFTLKVDDRVLPASANRLFHLNLKQDPLAIAMWHEVKPWSNKHFDVMRPYMKMLSNAGQKSISCALFNEIDQSETFSVPTSMIRWTKTSNGEWKFDYSILNKWIHFMSELGIDQHINLFSILPAHKQLFYFDEKSGETKSLSLQIDNNLRRRIYKSYFNQLRHFLKTNGWLDKTSIVIEDTNQQYLADFIYWMRRYEPDFKITLITKRYRPELLDSVQHLVVSPQYITAESLLEMKQAKETKTSLTVDCSLERPNLFSFSSPADAEWFGWFTASHELSGMYYAGFNNWTTNPLLDGRINKGPAGSNALIYPDCRSSIRFERLQQGIQDYEKIMILKTQLTQQRFSPLQKLLSKIDIHRMDDNEATNVINAGRNLLNQLSTNE